MPEELNLTDVRRLINNPDELFDDLRPDFPYQANQRAEQLAASILAQDGHMLPGWEYKEDGSGIVKARPMPFGGAAGI